MVRNVYFANYSSTTLLPYSRCHQHYCQLHLTTFQGGPNLFWDWGIQQSKQTLSRHSLSKLLGHPPIWRSRSHLKNVRTNFYVPLKNIAHLLFVIKNLHIPSIPLFIISHPLYTTTIKIQNSLLTVLNFCFWDGFTPPLNGHKNSFN